MRAGDVTALYCVMTRIRATVQRWVRVQKQRSAGQEGRRVAGCFVRRHALLLPLGMIAPTASMITEPMFDRHVPTVHLPLLCLLSGAFAVRCAVTGPRYLVDNAAVCAGAVRVTLVA
mmetsp:Transcript_66965/g.200067  ORF Transcript_66965/g.200067 Transcript_66965/m.200067 type:complete len:117 (+) Transcript_66965:276-626(+)